MSKSHLETVTQFDVLFAVRTGVTVLLPQNQVFDGGAAVPAYFSPQKAGDVKISAGKREVILKGLRPDYLEEAVARGTLMFYELKNDEVVRCTPCSLLK